MSSYSLGVVVDRRFDVRVGGPFGSESFGSGDAEARASDVSFVADDLAQLRVRSRVVAGVEGAVVARLRLGQAALDLGELCALLLDRGLGSRPLILSFRAAARPRVVRVPPDFLTPRAFIG